MPTRSTPYQRLADGVALAVLSGVLATLAAPPFELWLLILVAFAPMIVAQHRVLPARWSALVPGIALGLWFASQLLPGLVDAATSRATAATRSFAAGPPTPPGWPKIRPRRLARAVPSPLGDSPQTGDPAREGESIASR